MSVAVSRYSSLSRRGPRGIAVVNQANKIHDQESLIDQYRHALADFRKAEIELKQLEAAAAEAKEALTENEAYTAAFLNYVDSDAEGGQVESQCKQKLISLEAEIAEAEAELAAVKAIHHPRVALGLTNEKATLLIENQRTTRSIEMANEQIDKAKRQLASCLVSSRYRSGRELEVKHRELVQKRSYLRQKVTQNKRDFERAKPGGAIDKSDQARDERLAMLPEVDIQETLRRQREKKQRRPRRWDARISAMIDDIEELNERLVELRMGAFVVDVDELRAKYFSRSGETASKKSKDADSDMKSKNSKDVDDELDRDE